MRPTTVVEVAVIVLGVMQTRPSWTGCIISCIYAQLLQSKPVDVKSPCATCGIVKQGIPLGGGMLQ